jgi:putative transcription factor
MCEMCGTDDKLYKTDIEGSQLNVCAKCAKFGTVISAVREPVYERPNKPGKATLPQVTESEIIQVVAEDYSDLIKAAREKMGLKQEELAKAIAEKESLIHKLESGQFEPPPTLARKLEKYLHIKLIEQHEEKHGKAFKAQGSSMTIGDMLTMK